MNNTRLTRRQFVTSGLVVGAATTMLPGSVMALWQQQSKQGQPQEANAIVALIKKRLPNANLDEQSLHNYAVDLVRRVALERDCNTALYRAIFNNKAGNVQLEHFVVQDFLLRSNALVNAHLKQPVTYKI